MTTSTSQPFTGRAHSFTLNDRWGEPHEYTCTLHKAEEGQELMHEIMGVFAGSAGPVAMALLGGGMDADADLAGAGREAQRWLSSKASVKLVRRILMHTFRDAHPLNKMTTLNDAYTANYGEQAKAAWEVIQLNDFLPVRDYIADVFSKRNEKEEKDSQETPEQTAA